MTPVRFRVILVEPEKHRVRIEATYHGLGDSSDVTLFLPVWTPGSYLVREYAQFLTNVQATGDDGDARQVRKSSKSSWVVDTRDTNSIHVSYEVYGHDLGVRNNHIDSTHAFLTPTAVFLYPEDRLGDAIEVDVVAPANWQVFTQLRRLMDSHAFFAATDFDELFDSPIEVGPHPSFEFEVAGAKHTVVFWGKGNYEIERLTRDLPPIVQANAAVFGGKLPYESHLTVVLLTEDQFGGLEHRCSTALMYPRHEFSSAKGSCDLPVTDEKYIGFLSLFAHEHFHTWHVKRIRPEALGPFDYQRENYTRDLWTIEGITNYYNDLTLLRAGRIDAQRFLSLLATQIKRLDGVPGRFAQSLEESSYDAWIRLYRPHENNINATVSYYLKGHIVAALLDVYLRAETDGVKGLDDVMGYLWQHHSDERGYPEAKFDELVLDATGIDVASLFDKWVRRAEELELDEIFSGVGLKLQRTWDEAGPKPWIGISTKPLAGRLTVATVLAGTPAHGKLSPGDEIVAINGFRVGPSNLQELLRVAGVGNSADVHVFRDGILMTVTLDIGAEPPTKYSFVALEDQADDILASRQAWLGTREIKEQAS